MVAFSWKMEAGAQGEFLQAEFVGGCQRLGVDTIAALKGAVPALREAMADAAEYKKMYAVTTLPHHLWFLFQKGGRLSIR